MQNKLNELFYRIRSSNCNNFPLDAEGTKWSVIMSLSCLAVGNAWL